MMMMMVMMMMIDDDDDGDDDGVDDFNFTVYSLNSENFSRFDGYEMLRSIFRYNLRPKICTVNQKIIDIVLPQYNLFFRDSYMFLPVCPVFFILPLSNLSLINLLDQSSTDWPEFQFEDAKGV